MVGDVPACKPDMICRKMHKFPVLSTFWRSPSLMLMFSSIARAGSQLLPVLVMYAFEMNEAAALWLLIAGIIGLQSLLFLGAPQVLVRMLAYSSARTEREEAGHSLSEKSPVSWGEEQVGAADLVFLMKRLFFVASIIVPSLIALGGGFAIVNVVEQTGHQLDAWLAWVAAVAFLPVRVIALRDLTFLHGVGEIARPRLIDGLGWVLSGLLAASVFAQSRSLAAASIAGQIPLLISIFFLRRGARSAGWNTLSGAARGENLRRTFQSVWRPAWRAGAGQAISLGARQGTGIVLAQYVAAAEVAGFLMAMNVAVVVMMLGAAPVQAALPGMSKAYALGDTAQHCRIAHRALSRSLVLVALACGGIGLTIIPFLTTIGAQDDFVGPDVWLLISLTVLTHRYGAVHLQHYSITNHIFWHWLEGATGIINIILYLFLIPAYGGFGAAFSNLASILCLYIWVPGFFSRRRFGEGWRSGAILMVALCSSFVFIKIISGLIIISFN